MKTRTGETSRPLLNVNISLGRNDVSALRVGTDQAGGAGSENHVGELHLECLKRVWESTMSKNE